MSSPPPIRVLQVLIRLSPTGGVQTVVRRLAEQVDPAHVELHVTTVRPLFPEDELESVPAELHGLGYTRRGYRPIDRVRIAAAVARDVRRVRPDVVHLHSGTAWYGALARLLDRRPAYVIEVHDAPGSGRHSDWSDRFEGWWIRRLGAVPICHSSSVAGDIAESWSLPADRIRMFPLCVDANRFTPSTDDARRLAWRTANGVAPDEFLVTAVGRAVPSKRYDLAVDTLAGLVGAGVPAKLMIIGRGAGADDLRRRADHQGVGEHLIVRQDVEGDELPDALRSADVVVSTSEYEGFGLSIVEAMACAVPVVAMAAGGLTDVVDPDRTGLLVTPGDVPAMIEALRRLHADPPQRQNLGREGRDRVIRLFSAEAMAASFVATYAESTSSRWSSGPRSPIIAR